MIGANPIVEVSHSRTNTPELGSVPHEGGGGHRTNGQSSSGTPRKHRTAQAQVRHRRATVAEVALHQPKPVALLSSDSDDMTKLCGNQVRIIPLWLPARPEHARRQVLLHCRRPCPVERTTAAKHQSPPQSHDLIKYAGQAYFCSPRT